jgi:hypothetical protein
MNYTKVNGKYVYNKNGACFCTEEISLLIMQNGVEYTLVAHGDLETLELMLGNKRSRNKHILITSSSLDVGDLNAMITRGVIAGKIIAFMSDMLEAMADTSKQSNVRVRIIPPQEYEAEHRGVIDDFETLQIDRDPTKAGEDV